MKVGIFIIVNISGKPGVFYKMGSDYLF